MSRLVMAATSAGRPRGLAGVALILAAVPAVRAQDAAVPAAPAASTQVVEVRQAKNPAMMPYRKAYELLSKVDEAGAHRVRAIFRLTSPKSHQPVPDLRIVIEGENTHLNVPVSASGLVDLPFDRAAFADDADVIANVPKAALDVGFFVVPEIPAGTITYSDLAASVSAGQATLARVVPWYLRLLTSSIQGIGVCYPDDGHAVSIEGGSPATRAAREPDVDVAGKKVYCARFPVSEVAEHKDLVVVPQSGWEAIFW